MVKAFKVYVLPLIDYCSSVYNPHKIADIKLLERIQKKFTKNVMYRHKLSYPDRLKHLHLQSLEHRRLFSDLCLTYKIINGFIPSISNIFELSIPSKNTRLSKKPIHKNSEI